jgi:AcrR family transcriptional regulator
MPNAHSMRRAREIAHTRDDILDAAARVFAEAGYHDATMQAIARAAGFTAASLYTYFKSKDEIYEALVDDVRTAVLATFDARMPAGLSFAQRLELLLQLLLQLVAERRTALRIMFDRGPSRCRRAARPFEVLERLATFLRTSGNGDLRCPPEEAAGLLFGIVHSATLPWILADGPGDAPPVEAGRIVDLFLNGAAAATAPRAQPPRARRTTSNGTA